MNNNKPARKGKLERARYPRFLFEIDGKDVLCVSVPVVKYESMISTLKRRRDKIVTLTSKYNALKSYYKKRITDRIKIIDVEIEKLTK